MQTFSWISPASSLSSFLFAKFAAVVALKKILNDDQWKESRRMRDVKERTDVCENKQAPGASHRRLNLTDFWFDDRLPRQKFLVRGLEMESHLHELRQNVSSGHGAISAFVVFPGRFFIHILVPHRFSYLPFVYLIRLIDLPFLFPQSHHCFSDYPIFV